MTDTLVAEPESPVEAPEPEDFLPPHEVAPKAAKPEAKAYPCPHCEKVYDKGMDRVRKMNLENHIRHHHAQAAPKKVGLPKAAAAARAVPEPKPKARKPAGENLSLLVAGGAQFAAKAGYMPLANCLAFEAPAAGQAIDMAIAGTMVDRRIVQPFVGGAEKWEAVGACLGLPIMVHLCTVYPQMAGPLAEPMRRAAEEILVMSLPTIRKKVARDQKVAEALAELGHLDKAIADDPDPVGSIISGFFGAQDEEAASA